MSAHTGVHRSPRISIQSIECPRQLQRPCSVVAPERVSHMVLVHVSQVGDVCVVGQTEQPIEVSLGGHGQDDDTSRLSHTRSAIYVRGGSSPTEAHGSTVSSVRRWLPRGAALIGIWGLGCLPCGYADV